MQNKERKGKWQPFDALEGYRNALGQTEKEVFKKEKPQIMPDKAEEINETLKKAYKEKNQIKIEYYNKGYTSYIKGIIIKVDFISKKIIFSEETIYLKDIINATLM